MADSQLAWSEAQWEKVNNAVAEAFAKASVAGAFLPCYGPLAGGTETVRNERLLQDGANAIKFDVDHDASNLKLVNLTVHVDLSSEQVADEMMPNALLAFRRAANILAQEEDRIVFDGFDRGSTNSLFVANNLKPQKGLADPLERVRFDPVDRTGPSVVTAVVRAIRTLEDTSNPGPFACVLGNNLFDLAHEPSDSLVLPADRITPILKGPLLRSGMMNRDSGIVVSLSANAVDIVVGTPPTVQFLQRTEKGRFLFRVYERFVLRLRDTDRPPVAGFTIPDVASAAEGIAGAEQRVNAAQDALKKAKEGLKDARVAEIAAQEAEAKAREAEAKARLEAEVKARLEAEAWARLEVEAKARLEYPEG